MLVVLQHLAAFDLPSKAGIVDVVEALSTQGERPCRRNIRPERQVEWPRQATASAGDEEVHERPGRIVEAHDVGRVLSGDVQMIVRTERDADRDKEVAAAVREEI